MSVYFVNNVSMGLVICCWGNDLCASFCEFADGGSARVPHQCVQPSLSRSSSPSRSILPEGSDTTHAELSTRFQQSFTDKLDALCCKRSQQPADDRSTEVTARLQVFESASPSDVKRIVMTSAAKSCELDPLPTSLLKTHIDFLCQVLARIINTSLSSAVVPPPMKHAVVTPILKKRCSDVNILTN